MNDIIILQHRASAMAGGKPRRSEQRFAYCRVTTIPGTWKGWKCVFIPYPFLFFPRPSVLGLTVAPTLLNDRICRLTHASERPHATKLQTCVWPINGPMKKGHVDSRRASDGLPPSCASPPPDGWLHARRFLLWHARDCAWLTVLQLKVS